MVFIGLAVLLALMYLAPVLLSPPNAPDSSPTASISASLVGLSLFFFKLGALTFGGGSVMIALIQDQVVAQWSLLSPQEFVDGLALGRLTPGPVLVVTAYVGYKIAGITGAVLATVSSYLPSFILVLGLLPVFERVRHLNWLHAAMQGIGPAVSGLFAVALARMTLPALPDPFSVCILLGTIISVLAWRVGAIKLMLIGAGLGLLRSHLPSLTAFSSVAGAL